MASALCRSISNISRRYIAYSSVRYASAGPVIDPQKGKLVSDDVTMPDGLGHAVGPERWELLARLAGNEDPFEMKVNKRTGGTLDSPVAVPSMYEKRLVGCICEEDAISINWMYLHKGEQKRCQCGHWFKLVEMKPIDIAA